MKTILIVDDQPGIRLLLEEIFQNGGYQTEVARNGEEALQLVDEVKVDCVLLDMKMPGIDGVEVLKRLKKDWPHIPVLMMTGCDELHLTEQALQLGAERYFTKPFDIFEVKEAVDLLFER